MKKIVVGIAGASGAVYARRLIQVLIEEAGIVPDVIATTVAKRILSEEEGIDCDYFRSLGCALFDNSDFYTPPASGSAPYDAMIIVPCSMATVGKIASGIGDDLLCRAADVFLKEGRKLILVPRETPLNAIHLENLLKLARLGVVVLPSSPGFYRKPQSVAEVVDFVVDRMLMQLGVPHRLLPAWGDQNE